MRIKEIVSMLPDLDNDLKEALILRYDDEDSLIEDLSNNFIIIGLDSIINFANKSGFKTYNQLCNEAEDRNEDWRITVNKDTAEEPIDNFLRNYFKENIPKNFPYSICTEDYFILYNKGE